MNSQPHILTNPYIAGAPIKDETMFYGRDDIFEQVRARLIGQHQDNVVVIFGQRRTGKTSVLYQMDRRLNADRERYVAVLADLQGLVLDGMDNFLWGLARAIQRALRRDYQLHLSVPDRAAFQADARSAFRDTFLPSLCEIIGERRFLLMFDEAIRLEEVVSAGRLEKDVFDYLRSLMQHERDLSFIFSLGSKLEQMEQEYALMFNIALNLQVSFLDEDAARALVTKPVADVYTFDDSAVDHLLALTSRHPYFVQLLCHTLFAHWEQEGWSRVSRNEVDDVLDEAMSLAVANLQYIWNEANRAEKFVLAALAEMEPGEVDAAALGRHLKRASVPLGRAEVARALSGLARREVIISPAHPRFSVELIRRWLAREKPLAWVQEELQEPTPEQVRQGLISQVGRVVDKVERALGRTGLRALGGALLVALITLATWGISSWIRSARPVDVPVIDTQRRSADGMTMVLVPADEPFLMGSDPAIDPPEEDEDHEQPQHEVTLSAFWIDQTEVTNEQYEKCVQAYECEPSDFAENLDFNGADYPIVGVDWENARAYCQWVGGDLPTEAQWEKAARGTDGRIYPWGDAFDGTKANSCDVNCRRTYSTQSYDDNYGHTAPVNSYPEGASPYGALNMSGNVQEWVLDWYDPDYYKKSSGPDPTGPVTGTHHLIRGGSWVHGQRINRSAQRLPAARSDFKNELTGFRCVVDIKPTPVAVADATRTVSGTETSTMTPTSRPTPIATLTPTLPMVGQQIRLQWPVDNPEITQFFGENPQFYAEFNQAGHEGLDFVAPIGTNVYAAYDGVVYQVRPDDGNAYGLHVRLKHEVEGREFRTIYAYLSQVLVLEGQQVKTGELIALSGCTGYCFGPHLGFSLKIDGAKTPGYPDGIVNPLPYLEKTELPPVSDLIIYTTKVMRMRASPTTASTHLAWLDKGEALTVLGDADAARARVGQDGEWIQVQTETGLTGYVAAWYVSLTK